MHIIRKLTYVLVIRMPVSLWYLINTNNIYISIILFKKYFIIHSPFCNIAPKKIFHVLLPKEQINYTERISPYKRKNIPYNARGRSSVWSNRTYFSIRNTEKKNRNSLVMMSVRKQFYFYQNVNYFSLNLSDINLEY